jgi:tetratricopeptide (TPR) repeat protein
MQEHIDTYRKLAAQIGTPAVQRACYIAIGITYYNAGKFEEAHEAFSKISGKHAYSTEATISKAHCHFVKKEYDTVIDLLSDVHHKDAHNLCSQAHEKVGDNKHADIYANPRKLAEHRVRMFTSRSMPNLQAAGADKLTLHHSPSGDSVSESQLTK